MDIHLRAVTLDDPETLAHILIMSERGAFRGLVPDQCLQFTEAQSAANWRKFFSEEGTPSGSDFMVIAQTAEEEAVGYTWGGVKDDGDGIVRQLHVLPAYQGRGIGRQLVSHIAERLAEKGIHRMTVEVAQVNPNRAFYERIGATWLSVHPFDWDGVPMTMCVYQWADTDALLNRPDPA